jgi:hypothetical protein
MMPATAGPALVRRQAKGADAPARRLREREICLDRSRSRQIGIIGYIFCQAVV